MKTIEQRIIEKYKELVKYLINYRIPLETYDVRKVKTIYDDLAELEAQLKEQEEDFVFGDYVNIEQKRYGCENEMYIHKVINRLSSNTWVDVPVQSPATNVIHDHMEDVVSCICCGAGETEVLKYRVKDVHKPKSHQP